MKIIRRIGITTVAAALAGAGLLQLPLSASASSTPAGATSAPDAVVTSRLGSSVDNPADVARVSRLLGRPLTSVRIFLHKPPAQWSKSRLLASLPGNATVTVSFTSGTPTQVKTFLAGHPAHTTCYATYVHEPEKKFPTAAAQARYKASWHAYAPAIRAAGCVPTMILMKWTLNAHSGRNWLNWYSPADMDVIAFDAYNGALKRGAYSQPARYLAPVIAAAKRVGKPWALAEVGSYMDGTPAQRAAWAHGIAVVAMAHGARFADWWDHHALSGGKDFRLDAATARAWR